jgi:transposase
MLSSKVEQRVAVMFLVKLNKMPTECFRILTEAYGADCMSRARVFEWHKRFSEGREDVKGDERPGRPCTSKTNENVEKIEKIVRIGRRLSIRMIAEMVNIDKETVRHVLHEDLNMTKVCAKMVPRLLTPEQKEN